MGINYKCQVVAGFPVTKTPLMKIETKYNQDTGEPYEKGTEIGDQLEHNGVVISEKAPNDDQYHYAGEKILGMEIFESGFEEGELILGVEIVSARDGEGMEEFNVDTLPVVVDKFAQTHNITPVWALVMSCG